MYATPKRFAALLAVVVLATIGRPAPANASFTAFESGQVRPLALTPDGTRLLAVNTPDNQLEVFDVTASGITHTSSVPVGLEPVAVALRSNGEAWVVNHLSDSISIVDLTAATPHVVRTLLVGDEPRDIVFGGPGGNRAFITTAHRGQQRLSPDLAGVPGAGDPQFTTPGVGRADVWVFDANSLGSALGGVPVRIVTLFGDTPRALAVSTDGATVYAAVFKSGNLTTTVSEGLVCNGFGSAGPCTTPQGFTLPGGLPPPSTDAFGEPAPETGLIVKYNKNAGTWEDELGRDWSDGILFSLPDLDVFKIDASTLAATTSYSGVGTTLFNIAVNPVSGAVYVSNTEARNEVRFEGPGIYGNSTVQGHLAESRITILDGANVLPRHLNKHIDYDLTPAPVGTKEHSLATPVGMAVTPDGATLYVAAFGSSRIGVLPTASLADDSFDPTTASANYIPVSGGGPSGLVLDSARQRLYVLTRFDDAVSVIDLAGTPAETAHVALHNPEPAKVVNGRRFLYDANLTSSNGEASCSSCHIFGDMDDLAWDLGNPDDKVKKNPIPINLAIAITFSAVNLPAPINGSGLVDDFHPMKGPMTTQTLRGMKGSGAMHWRGDRSNPPGTPGSAFNEVISFNNFNPAFPGLVGREEELAPADMQKFTDFALEIKLPPNPIRAIDGSLTAAQQAGKNFYFGTRRSDGLASDINGVQLGFNCNGCHTVDAALGHFGTAGKASFENEEQIIKIPHLRNMYQKVGMFGVADVPFEDPLNQPFRGDQIRGFGFLHDGSVDTLHTFLNAVVFSGHSFGGSAVGFQNDTQRRNVEQFLLAFDTNLAPAVGQQVTLGASNAAVAGPRIDVLTARAAAGDCDLVAKASIGGVLRGWVRTAGSFRSDRSTESTLSDAQLRALATTSGQEITYTCVPPGDGQRIGVDRDGDGFFDQDEADAGTDPTDPESYPGALQVVGIRATSLVLNDDATPPVDGKKRKIRLRSSKQGASASGVIVPARGGTGDPTNNGATVTVYRPDGGGTMVTIPLPSFRWRASGSPAKRYVYSDPKGESGPIRSAQITDKALSLRGVGGALFALDQAPQGSVAVRVKLGSELEFCAAAPAKTSGNPPSTAKNDTTAHFIGTANTAAPAVCPPLPVVGSASHAFLVETSSLTDF
jgi:DNA-binding beta-propeller fold protein YncE